MRLALSWISCTVVGLLQWNLAHDILMILAIKRVRNLLTHLLFVSTLPDITQKPKIYVVFLSIVWVVLKRTDLACKWLWKELVVWLDHSRCLKWRPFAFTHTCSRVCHWSMASSIMLWWKRSKVSMNLCFSSSVSRFGFCVMSGSEDI